MKCGYRNCSNEIEQNPGQGRKKKFCHTNCKRMEYYYVGKEGVENEKKPRTKKSKRRKK